MFVECGCVYCADIRVHRGSFMALSDQVLDKGAGLINVQVRGCDHGHFLGHEALC